MKLLKSIYTIGFGILLCSNLALASYDANATITLEQEPINYKNDWQNIDFRLKLTNIDFRHEMNQVENTDDSTVGTIEYIKNNALVATASIVLFPNTFYIRLSYTGLIGEEVLYEHKDDYNDNSNGVYAIDEGEQEMQWFDIYTKPISTTYGELGFGYNLIKNTSTFITQNNINILDKKDTVTNSALTSSNEYMRHKVKTQKYYMTYNIPWKNRWLGGFGVQYMYETSNVSQMIEPGSIVFSPDATSNIYSIGIIKTLDEVESGFNIKTLYYGFGDTTYEYYNYITNNNESLDVSSSVYKAEIIYMYKPDAKQQYYVSGGVFELNDEFTQRMEFVFELGIMF